MVDNIKYTFEINPGCDITGAEITDATISVDRSIFTRGQSAMIDALIAAERERLQTEFAVTLEEEKKQAWQSGNHAGITQTKSELMPQITELTEVLKKSIENLAFQNDVFCNFHEHEILNLIIKMTRKVIGVEIVLNPSIVIASFKRCLECLTEKEEIKIMVNPGDWGIMKESLNNLSLNVELPKHVEIISNAEIAKGGCRVEYKAGSIDADIENQFNEILRNLNKE